jgi:hypothetical protein
MAEVQKRVFQDSAERMCLLWVQKECPSSPYQAEAFISTVGVGVI